MMSDTNPIVRQNIDPLSLAVYFVPLLLNIITPNLRPVSFNVIQVQEHLVCFDSQPTLDYL